MTDEVVECSNCGEKIPEEKPGDPLEKRKPCPKCGALNRSIPAGAVSFLGVASIVANAVIERHWTRLLETSKALIELEHFAPAVIVAHTACEVIVQRAASKAFQERKIADLEREFDAVCRWQSLLEKEHCKLFKKLTGDEKLTEQKFWKKQPTYKSSVERRNKVVHAGKDATKDEAEETLQICESFISYIEKTHGLE
ncbi:hypothetical protein Mal52_51130 [Symmachiella dynata]|uniref:HEPN domain-containing protein n=1 Tax=Symmachiella dynata TaxID=2527995 RepID=A0A517ZVW1_9PLAN|nr:hypothetical protein [Symmachiella dynata]QDU46591.1 hypothetical protein Mal52_51130 [Symmachiella dynata]